MKRPPYLELMLKGLVEILGSVELLVVAHQLVLQLCHLQTKQNTFLE
jgi:hypothetical protein